MSSLESMYTAAVMYIGRTIHRIRFDPHNGKFPRGEYGGIQQPSRVPVDKVEEANLISSHIKDDIHAPVIDFDFPAYLIPSTSPGHFHLYLEKEMKWRDYKKLLDVMLEVGLIEKGWYDIAMKFEQTYARLPHIKKELVPTPTRSVSGYMNDY